VKQNGNENGPTNQAKPGKQNRKQPSEQASESSQSGIAVSAQYALEGLFSNVLTGILVERLGGG
jgi:hypothetical protein